MRLFKHQTRQIQKSFVTNASSIYPCSSGSFLPSESIRGTIAAHSHPSFATSNYDTSSIIEIPNMLPAANTHSQNIEVLNKLRLDNGALDDLS